MRANSLAKRWLPSLLSRRLPTCGSQRQALFNEEGSVRVFQKHLAREASVDFHYRGLAGDFDLALVVFRHVFARLKLPFVQALAGFGSVFTESGLATLGLPGSKSVAREERA